MNLQSIIPIVFLVAGGASFGAGVFWLASGKRPGSEASEYLVAGIVMAIVAIGFTVRGTAGLVITTVAVVAGSFVGIVIVRRRHWERLAGMRDAPRLRE